MSRDKCYCLEGHLRLKKEKKSEGNIYRKYYFLLNGRMQIFISGECMTHSQRNDKLFYELHWKRFWKLNLTQTDTHSPIKMMMPILGSKEHNETVQRLFKVTGVLVADSDELPCDKNGRGPDSTSRCCSCVERTGWLSALTQVCHVKCCRRGMGRGQAIGRICILRRVGKVQPYQPVSCQLCYAIGAIFF